MNIASEIVDRLMHLVRSQFCGSMSGSEWGKHSHFIRKNVILWPARFICDARCFNMTGERYEAIMRSIFLGIKQHMTDAQIRYWPGYLMKCVQDHWNHHWEEYYQESKSVSNLTFAGLAALRGLQARPDRSVEALAAAHRILATKAKRRPGNGHRQLGLL